MKILIVSPASGGIAKVADRLTKELTARDYEVVRRAVPDGKGAIAWREMRRAWSDRSTIRDCDVLHLELGMIAVGAFWYGLIAALLARCTVVVAHDAPTVTKLPGAVLFPVAAGWRDAVGYRIVAPLTDRLLKGLLFRRTSVGVTLSAAARDRWTKGPKVIDVVEHGADVAQPTALPSIGTTVVFAGFLGQSKGIDVLLDAWAIVGQSTGMTLCIAGDSPTRQEESWVGTLKERSRSFPSQPVWVHELDDQHFDDTIGQAGMVVLPYRTSNPASGVLIKAMAFGRAVIVSDVPAAVGTVNNEDSGLVVPPGDAETLGKALLRLANDPELRDRLGARAHATAAQRFSWTEHAQGIVSAYAQASRGVVDE